MDPPGRPGYPFGTHPRGATLTYYTVASTLTSPICGVTGATLGLLLEETAGPRCTCGCSAGPAAGTVGLSWQTPVRYPVPAGRYLEHPLSTRQRVPGAGAGVQFLGKKKTDTQPGTRPWFGQRYANTLTDPLNIWLAGGLHLQDGSPVDPLKWWIQQQRAGNNHGGLLQMALDVLSCPATTVDVERKFNFGRDYVLARRHRLNASSVTRGMTVAFYSRNGYCAEKKVLYKQVPAPEPGYRPPCTRVPALVGVGAGSGVQNLRNFRRVPAPAVGTRVQAAISSLYRPSRGMRAPLDGGFVPAIKRNRHFS
ncbi:hypothetical protein PCANC_26118 [Puccinia coronata f. sp. avenae]|uniref:HAT C-terminal dimerisation domain-containing protein n=1 Tax=Puccinia coronata f. sp. avenae TaxID=200324 RepID=A0A2N5TNZ0_9BASI|nr:hypothetical protein PCANC_26118 [Puccinia coronata f. sp. avenae]